MKKNIIIFFLSLTIGIGLFAAVLLQTGLGEIWNTIRNFSLLYFIIFVILSTVNFALYTLRWYLITRRLYPDQLPSFTDFFLHRMAGFALSYITPVAQAGGEPLRIVLLHQHHIPTKTATSSVIIDKGLELAALIFFIGTGMAFALLDGSLSPETRLTFGLILILFIALIFWFYYTSLKNIGFFTSLLKFFRFHRFSRFERTLQKITEIEVEMAHFYKNNGKLFFLLIFISIITSAFLLLEHYLVALFMGVHMNFFQTFMVSTIPYLAYLLPLPGGLGILESGHAAIFALLGVQINAVALVLIIRIRDLLFVFIGLIHASKQGLKMIRNAFFNKA